MDCCACAEMHGRSLQGYLPLNNTGKDEAIAISDARGKATAESIMDYIHKATPQAVQDLVTPVGNYTGQLHTLSVAQLYEAFHHSNHLSWVVHAAKPRSLIAASYQPCYANNQDMLWRAG